MSANRTSREDPALPHEDGVADSSTDLLSPTDEIAQPRPMPIAFVTAILTGCILIAGIVTHFACVATLSRDATENAQPAFYAVILSLFGSLPAFWLARMISLEIARPLVVTGWRFGMLLPAILLHRELEPVQRNYFIIALLACYFVALLLESWLLVRDTRARPANSSSS